MSLKHWILIMLGIALCSLSSAKFCTRRYVGGKWIAEGDCGGPEMMSEIMRELQSRAEDEKKLTVRAEHTKKNPPKKSSSDKEWTVFQRRKYGNVDFFLGWDDYEEGFGNHEGDFWLGLEELHQKTKAGNMELEINMITKDAEIYWVAKYSKFRVGPRSDNYTLSISGYSGNSTGNGLARHNNHQFSTKDADHDAWADNCAIAWEGGWWYRGCARANLNGNFNKTGLKGMFWWPLSTANMKMNGIVSSPIFLRYSEMKIRRRV